MKPQQQAQARRMFIQSDLSKSEIGETLNVDRRTIYQWSIDGDWDKLKTSAKCMPSMLAEKCYYLIGHFTDHLLSTESHYQSVTKSDVDIIYKLAKTINILKKGSTVNEDMETFTWFLEGLQKRDAGLAQALIPYADTFISCRTATNPSEFRLSGHDAQGNKPFPEKEIMEKWRDEQDAAAIAKEMQDNAAKNQNPNNSDGTGEPTSEPAPESPVTPLASTNNPAAAEAKATQPSSIPPELVKEAKAGERSLKDQVRRANYQQILEQKRLRKENKKKE